MCAEGAHPEKLERLDRPSVPELDDILGVRFRVLDEGFIRLIDYMGNDAAVIQAARISYGTGTKRTQEDRGLIRFLMRHFHTTPFEMCEIKLHVRVPMDTWRQWIRHRTANVNEYSTRYSLAIDSAQRTAPTQWRLQSLSNRQGSGGNLPANVGDGLSSAEDEFQQKARRIYQDRIAAGVAREQARKDLPLSTYTEAYWKIDLHNLLHFLFLRMDEHAQSEIRKYATIIGERIVAKWVPIVWEAFLDYRLQAVQLSRIEFQIISALLSKNRDAALRLAADSGFLSRKLDGSLRQNRERNELEAKLHSLLLPVPWE